MVESAEFMATLNHTNLERPVFGILRAGYPMLLIDYLGQRMEVPMAEILEFARRWREDFESQRPKSMAAGKLHLVPYSLISTRLDDPDVREVAWD